jgi:hypothetical protein
MTTPQPPAPLPRSARTVLAAYRDAHELPGDARDRIWEVVGSDDAPEPAFDPREEEERGTGARGHDERTAVEADGRRRGRAHVDRRERAASSRRRAAPAGHARGLGWGTATLAAAAVLVLAWQLGGTLAERRQAERTPGAAVMQGGGDAPRGRASAADRGRTSPSEPSSNAPASPPTGPDPAIPASPSATAEPSTSKPRTDLGPATAPSARTPRSSGDPAATTSETTDPSGSTLAAERELVARAWGALALGETAQALEAAAEHARRFPEGLLAPERTAIDAIARCRRGDADGPRRASAFHRAHPRSPLVERVDEACAAAPKESTGP